MRRVAAIVLGLGMLAATPLTAEQDHQRLMGLLHISALRPGVNGNDPAAPNAANYDEAKASPYSSLPDPLRFKNGRLVTSAAQWRRRRVEIAADFNREVYGRVPPHLPNVRWKIIDSAVETVGNLQAITRHLIGHAGGTDPRAVDIQLVLSLPASAREPVPVILQIGSGKTLTSPASTWREQVLAKGWGAATLIATSVQPDDGAGLAGGIIGLGNKGRPRKPDDWGALRAWAWGASRVLDYLQTDAAVDERRVGIAGHSRYGKAALVAMAYDERFAIAYVSSSGAGGAGLLRRNFGERIENLAGTNEYHWFAGNFLKYAGPLGTSDLPVDAHELIALSAPRPVFIGVGSKGDGWVDARGMFLAEVEAGRVYELLGKQSLDAVEMPPVGTALASGNLAFRQHEDGHTPEPNWPFFLSFAQRFLHPLDRG
ncbi:MAG TPA: hypothetical protein VII56_09820 [Rhizomicrobium sp.]